jgi:hypothetical protein
MHELWHVVVLVAALLGASGALFLAAGPLVFETPPPALARGKHLVVALVGLAVVIVLVEWLWVH